MSSANAAAVLADTWGEAVRANREQAERLREAPDQAGDHYAPIAAAFRADPRRSGDPTLTALRGIAQPTDIWLDVGAGAGRFALALAGSVREVIGIEPSTAMRAEFEQIRTEHGIENARILNQRWPTNDPLRGDVALISHVGYDIEPISAFLDTLERSARRECIAVMFDQAPGNLFHELWPRVHGEPQELLPGLRELLVLLKARGAAPTNLHRSEPRRWSFDSLEDAEAAARRRLWLQADSPKLPALREVLTNLLKPATDGGLAFPTAMTQTIVRWQRPPQ